MTLARHLDKENEFFQSLGRCIAAWSEVERELFQLCELAMAANRAIVSVVFYRFTTLGARLSLVNELVVLRLPKTKPGKKASPALKRWVALNRDINNQFAIRTRLAHHPVSTVSVWVENALAEDASGQEQVQHRLEMIAHMNAISNEEALRGRRDDQKPLYQSDLQDHVARIKGLAAALRAFGDEFLTNALPVDLTTAYGLQQAHAARLNDQQT